MSRYKAEQAISTNAKRRNLTPSQLAAVAADSERLYEAEAKARMISGKPVPKLEQGRAIEKAANAAGVSKGYAADAKRIKEDAPETFEKLKSGETTLQEAKTTALGFDMARFDLRRGSREPSRKIRRRFFMDSPIVAH